jgi:hypothetical protein
MNYIPLLCVHFIYCTLYAECKYIVISKISYGLNLGGVGLNTRDGCQLRIVDSGPSQFIPYNIH